MLFKKLLIIFLLATGYLLLAAPVSALKFGPHMVCNTNPESFADVRNEYNQLNGWTGIDHKIPATIILQTNTPIEVISTTLAAARDNGIIPYIRLAGPGFWDQIDETEALRFATNLNLAAGSSGLSGIYVAPGNEVNRDDEWTGPDKIGSLAKALNTLLANAQNYKVAFPGLDLYYNGDSWRSFLTNFNNQNHELLKRLGSEGAFVAHSYTEASNRNPNKWQEEQGFLNSIGVNAKFLFYEANLHPAINAGADEQARYIKEVAFPAYNSNSAIEIVTPFSRAKPADNTASSDNPYLMLVIKEDGSQAKFIPFPHPADNCGGIAINLPNTPGKSSGETLTTDSPIAYAQTKILNKNVEAYVHPQRFSPQKVNFPNFSPMANHMVSNILQRLLPGSLKKKFNPARDELTGVIGHKPCNEGLTAEGEVTYQTPPDYARAYSSSFSLSALVAKEKTNSLSFQIMDNPAKPVLDVDCDYQVKGKEPNANSIPSDKETVIKGGVSALNDLWEKAEELANAVAKGLGIHYELKAKPENYTPASVDFEKETIGEGWTASLLPQAIQPQKEPAIKKTPYTFSASPETNQEIYLEFYGLGGILNSYDMVTKKLLMPAALQK